MRLLLDSHVGLWALEDHPSLGSLCRELLISVDEVYFSVVTPWELGIKQALGKLAMPSDLAGSLGAAGFEALPISLDHAVRAPQLPPHHRDPFDRMLVAQAQVESLTLVSADRALELYDVDILDPLA